MAKAPTPLADRFWPKVDKRGPDECWLWLSCQHSFGYGLIGKGGRGEGVLRAHRVAWELIHGPIPQGMCVLHRCDNPPCVNPSHLVLGTVTDNHMDMMNKGRHRYVTRAGEACHLSKLTEADVRKVRARARQGEIHRSIASDFGVARANVSYIVRRTTWRHVA